MSKVLINAKGGVKIVNISTKKFSNYLLVSSLGVNIIGSVFVLFLSSIKGFSVREISLIVGTTPLIILPIFFIWGSILDKYKKVIGFSRIVHISNIVTIGLLIIINNFILFFIINLLRSILLQPNGTLNDKYLLNISKINKGSYGNIRVRSTIGYGLAGIVAPIAIGIGDVYLAIFAGILLVTLSVIMLNNIQEIPDEALENHKIIKEREKNLVSSLKELIKNTDYIKALIIISIITGTQNAASGYGLQMMMIDLKVSKSVIALIPFIMVIFEVLLLLTFDKIKVLKKNDVALAIALGFLVIRWGAMAYTTSYILILIVTTLHGIVTAIVLQVQNKLIGQMVPVDQHFIAFILLSSFSSTILPSLLNLSTGRLYERFGIHVFGLTYLSIVLIAILVLAYGAIKNNVINKKQDKNIKSYI